jgi:hypothetical protein
MARSWPLQEAALVLELYVKFADGRDWEMPESISLEVGVEADGSCICKVPCELG